MNQELSKLGPYAYERSLYLNFSFYVTFRIETFDMKLFKRMMAEDDNE